jgi:hypothetical protein
MHLPTVIEAGGSVTGDPRASLLITTLPPAGSEWSPEARRQRHIVADAIFDQIYKNPE